MFSLCKLWAHVGSGCVASAVLNIGTRWTGVITFKQKTLDTRRKCAELRSD